MPRKPKPKPDPAAHAQRRYTQASFERFQRLGMEGTIAWKGGPYIVEEGYPPVKRGKGSSEYDPAKWGPPEFPADDNTVCMKKDVAKIFCLNANDIVDLCYRKRPVKVNDQKEHIAHDYLASELERRAWEKYGGPEGLKIAREKRDKRVARTKATKQRRRDKKGQADVQPESTHYYKKDITEPQSPEGDVRIISANDKPPMVLCVGKQPSPHSRGRNIGSRGFSGNDLNNSESSSDSPDYYAEGGACDMKHAAFMGFIADLQSGRYGDEDELRRRREQQSAPGIQSTPIQSTQNQITSAGMATPSGPPPTTSSSASVSERKRRGVKRNRESESSEGKDNVVSTLTAGHASSAAAYSTPPTTPYRPSSKRCRAQSGRDKDDVDVVSGSSYPTPMSTSSKNKLPKTSKVRDLTRRRKERDSSQVKQAATPSSDPASSLVPSGRKAVSTSANAASGSKTLS
ncbi:hypothetical protein CPC08DRAFT_716009 [Agrocybe pediades]|nr:hypothetical protein CPC08DRAFT_716009 [Agrocybe pediades]